MPPPNYALPPQKKSDFPPLKKIFRLLQNYNLKSLGIMEYLTSNFASLSKIFFYFRKNRLIVPPLKKRISQQRGEGHKKIEYSKNLI